MQAKAEQNRPYRPLRRSNGPTVVAEQTTTALEGLYGRSRADVGSLADVGVGQALEAEHVAGLVDNWPGRSRGEEKDPEIKRDEGYLKKGRYGRRGCPTAIAEQVAMAVEDLYGRSRAGNVGHAVPGKLRSGRRITTVEELYDRSQAGCYGCKGSLRP
ncbi:hypothetical protein Dimus_000768 [Dionaea muscipula]